MPAIEPSKEGIFSNPVYGARSVEDQKRGLFANPPTTTQLGGFNSAPADPSQSRLNLAGLVAGGFKKITNGISSLLGGGLNGTGLGNSESNISYGNASNTNSYDWRVRISASQSSGVLYWDSNPGILQALLETDGVIFPYVPSVTVTHAAKYNSQALTHSNYQNYFYESSEVSQIQISGDFTVQNTTEALYLLAVIQFFRASTKMFYGQSEQYQGSPPPIVYLDGYGQHYLPHVPCVVTQFTHTMPQDVDYIEYATPYVDTSGYTYDNLGNPVAPTNSGANEAVRTRVPTASTVSVTLQPVYSRKKQREFNYSAFSRGDLIKGGYL